MPRRGEQQRDFPEQDQRSLPVNRIGIRVVRVPDRTGVLRDTLLDPAEFRCAALAGELADEWVDYVDASRVTGGMAQVYRRAVRDFCATVDAHLVHTASAASLERAQPDVAAVLAAWERALPAGHRAGSTTPAVLASAVRALIARRAQHEARPVAAHLRHLVEGDVGVAWGATQEVDEFSRKDKRALVRAAWAYVNKLDQRLTQGWTLAAQGRHPAEDRWTSVPNLLWGLANQQVSPRDIRDNLPVIHQWPPPLRAGIEQPDRPVYPARAKEMLTRWLVHQLYPSGLDLHAFRVLLVAATGHAPEEVTTLTEGDVEFLPAGVRLRLTKQRARRVRHRVFRGDDPSTDTATGEPVEFVDRPHREVAAIIRRLMRATEQARLRTPDADRLFTAASVTGGYELRIVRWDANQPRARFVDWLAHADLTVEGAPDIRRLRKSTKVEKAIAFGGRVADAANDHHEETFRGHYAQGTTLRVLSGQVIATAQDHWFRRAVDGPTVLTDATTGILEQPDGFDALGLTSQEAGDLRQGALDMGVTGCRDPYDSPYSPQGQLCAVAPLRCLECRNAWVLPSHLPQLLLFSDHLDRLRTRLTPQHFAALWGQSYVNLHAVLADRTDDEKALARRHIDAEDIGLHLSMAANVEFDS
jgi:hypothetical protein